MSSRPPRGPGTGRPSGRPDFSSDRQRSPRPPIAVTPGGTLPKWVREEIVRTTSKDRREPALLELTNGLTALADDRPGQALGPLRRAKGLAPAAATIRELLGLAAYQVEIWEEALRELRAFRRIAGETIHMPVELDCLRALGRGNEIEKTWNLLLELGSGRETDDEARVVYASYLLGEGNITAAWQLIKPGRLVANAPESALRRWATAARVAARSGDRAAAESLLDAIRRQQPDLPWLDSLTDELSR